MSASKEFCLAAAAAAALQQRPSAARRALLLAAISQRTLNEDARWPRRVAELPPSRSCIDSGHAKPSNSWKELEVTSRLDLLCADC